MAIVDVVKYDGCPDVFAWKYPNHELGTWTQLIVNESQEAILVKGGQVCDVFGPGKHTLSTDNLPILKHIVNLPFGGRSPFTAEVWYINKAFNLDVKWGTTSPIQLQDPKYKIFVPVRAFGQFGVQISDARCFLTKLVGTLPAFDRVAITKFFRGLYLTKSKDVISSYLVHKSVSILEINAYLDEMSEYLYQKLVPAFEKYGIYLSSFYVNDVNVPDDDEAVIQLKKALAKRAEMDIVGYSYQQERSFNTLEGVASNAGSMQSGFLDAGIGLGMGMGVGNTLGHQFGNMTQYVSVENQKECPSCKAKIGMGEKFCHICGFDTNRKPNKDDIVCSVCGSKLSKESKFCSECGKKYIPCSNCMADLPEGATTCPVCGEKVPICCPNCGASISPNSKFCWECGHAMVRKCSNCGNTLTPQQKFCPECGTVVK